MTPRVEKTIWDKIGRRNTHQDREREREREKVGRRRTIDEQHFDTDKTW